MRFYLDGVLILNNEVDDDKDKFITNWFEFNHPDINVNVFLDKEKSSEIVGVASNIRFKSFEILCDIEIFDYAMEKHFKNNPVILYPKPFGKVLRKKKFDDINIIEQFVITGIDLNCQPHSCKNIPPVNLNSLRCVD